MKTTYYNAIKQAMGHGVFIFKDGKELYNGDYMPEEDGIEAYMGLFGIQPSDTVYIKKYNRDVVKIWVKE